MSHTIKLAPKREGFYCPLSGLNLSLAEPQATISEAVPISRTVQLAISLGSLIDVTGNYPKLSDSTITSAMIADGSITVDHMEDLVALYAAAKAASEAAAIPSVTEVAITGDLVVGQDLTLAYTFVPDAGGETESGSTFVWSIADTVDGIYAPISGATAVTYTILEADIGKFIEATVTPRDLGGESGTAVTSAPVGPIPSNVVTVTGVTVQDVVATGSGTTWAVELPLGTVISENPVDVVVVTTDENATTAAVFATDTWTITVTAADEVTTATVTVAMTVAVAPPSTETDILTFSFAEQTGPATIDATAHTVAIEVASGTNETVLTPTITVSAGATIAPESGVVQTFAAPVNYTVTAEDGTTEQVWVVTVTIAAAPLSASAELDFTAVTGTRLADVVLTDATTDETGADEANAMPLTVTIADIDKATALFVPVTDNATVTAYANDGTPGGSYAEIAANYDFTTNTTLWIKVISEDTSATLFYKLAVTVAA